MISMQLRWMFLRLRILRARLMRLSAPRAVLLLAVLFLLLLALGDGVLLWLERVRKLDEATQDAANLTVVLEQDLRQSLERLDGLLQTLVAVRSKVTDPLGPASPYAFLLKTRAGRAGMRIYGAGGRLESGTQIAGPQARDWSAQEVFVQLRDHPQAGPFIGAPIVEDGILRHPLGRRISGKDGTFKGVAVVLASADTFPGIFDSLNLGRNGSIGIIRRDGVIIARFPAVAPGASVAGAPIFSQQIAPLAQGMISGSSYVDGVAKIGHFRSVAGMPLVIVVLRDEDDALISWRSLVELHVVILGAVALAVALLVTLIWSQQAGLAAASAAVQAEQRRVETMTAHLPAVLVQGIREQGGSLRFPYISRGAEQILGMAPAHLASNPGMLLERMPPAEAASLTRSLDRSFSQLTDVNEEFRLAHPDGKERWLRFNARPRRLAHGAIAWEGLFLDVTAHKAAVSDKQALERRLEAIMNRVPGVVFQRIQRPDGTVQYTFISPAVQSIFGVSPEEVVRDSGVLIARTVPEDREAVSENFMRQHANGGEWELEFRVIGPDGQIRWVRGAATRHTAQSGEIVWDGLFLDITLQKAAAAATLALQRRMEAIVADIPGAVFECVQSAAGMRFSFLSPQAAAIFGIPLSEALHDFESIKTHVLPEDRAAIETPRVNEISHRDLWTVEFRVQPPGDALRWVRGTARVRRHDGSSYIWNGVFQDITEAKAAEEGAQRAQRNQALAHLTAGVAHEFNNLLTVIQGNLELISMGKGETAELAESSLRAAERGANVTKALQAYARRQALRPVTGTLPEMLHEVTSLLNSILGQSIQLQVKLPKDVWPIHVDWEQLGNALIILTVNGKEAMANGGTLRLEASNTALREPVADLEPGDYVRISVSDSGQGMPEDLRRHAFDPFYSRQTVGGGSAQGLSTVFGFVKQSHGHVSLESRQGEGTTITMLLPRSNDRPFAASAMA
jgi:PAS domain S-box-containing protein